MKAANLQGETPEIRIRLAISNFFEINGVKELFDKWLQETSIQEIEKTPIAKEIESLWIRTKTFETWSQENINDPADFEIINDGIQKTLKFTQEIKSWWLNLEPKERLKQIEKEYSLKIINYTWDELLRLKEFFEEHRARAIEPPDFKEINEKVDSIQNINIDKEIAKYQLALFPHLKGVKKVEDTPLEDGKRFLTCKKDRGYQKTKWNFILPKEAKDPTFSRNIWRIYQVTNLYALAQKTLNPFIRRGDIVKRLGGSKWLYGVIDSCYDFLTMATYEITDKEKRTREIGHLVNYVKQFNIGTQGSYYYLEFNPHHHPALKAISEGKKIPPSSYIPIPIQALQPYPTREIGIVNLVLQYRGLRRIRALSIRKILKEGIGLSKGEIEKGKGYLAKKLDQGLDKIKAYDFEWEISKDSLKTLNKRTKFLQFTSEQLQKDGFKKGIVDKFKSLKKILKESKQPIPQFSTGDFLKLKIVFKDVKIPKKTDSDQKHKPWTER